MYSGFLVVLIIPPGIPMPLLEGQGHVELQDLQAVCRSTRTPGTGTNCNCMSESLSEIEVIEAESRGLARTDLRGLTCLYLVLWLAYSLTGAGSFAAAARDPEVGPRPVLGAKEHSARSPWCSSSFF